MLWFCPVLYASSTQPDFFMQRLDSSPGKCKAGHKATGDAASPSCASAPQPGLQVFLGTAAQYCRDGGKVYCVGSLWSSPPAWARPGKKYLTPTCVISARHKIRAEKHICKRYDRSVASPHSPLLCSSPCLHPGMLCIVAATMATFQKGFKIQGQQQQPHQLQEV